MHPENRRLGQTRLGKNRSNVVQMQGMTPYIHEQLVWYNFARTDPFSGPQIFVLVPKIPKIGTLM